MNKGFNEIIITTIVRKESSSKVYSKQHALKFFPDVRQMFQEARRHVFLLAGDDLIIKVAVAIKGRLLYMEVPAEEKFCVKYKGPAAHYDWNEFGIKLVNYLETGYININDVKEVVEASLVHDVEDKYTEVSTVDKRTHGGPNLPEDMLVDIGRRGVPMRGVSRKRRPSIDVLDAVYKNTSNKQEFIRTCSKKFNIQQQAVYSWYDTLLAIRYSRIKHLKQWPGNEVMIQHYNSKTTRRKMSDMYGVSVLTIGLWTKLVHDVLLDDPHKELKGLTKTSSDQVHAISPSYETLKSMAEKHTKPMFTYICMTTYKCARCTAELWYRKAIAMASGVLPVQHKYPGDGVMLSMYLNGAKASDIRKQYKISGLAAQIWVAYIREKHANSIKGGLS